MHLAMTHSLMKQFLLELEEEREQLFMQVQDNKDSEQPVIKLYMHVVNIKVWWRTTS